MGFFVTVLIQGYMVEEIMKNDDATLNNSIDIFYKVGWAGFALVFFFNLGHVGLLIWDICLGCNSTNR
jgi:hypothetical protein